MPTRSAAFTLPDTLVGVTLALVTLALSVPVVQWCSVSLHRTETAAASAASFDHAMDLLRQDVWQAHQIQLNAADHLTLVSAAGQVTWQIGPDGALRRQMSGGADQHWQPPTPGIRFGHVGPIVTVTIPDSPGHAGYALAMTNPPSLFAEAHP